MRSPLAREGGRRCDEPAEDGVLRVVGIGDVGSGIVKLST